MLLKGICHPDDARRAIDAGVDGIYCSNHGGRQANGGIAAIDMLPARRRGGRRHAGHSSTPACAPASDVVKALALGAARGRRRSALRLRPRARRRDGIAHVLRCLLAEADLLMAVNGYPTIADLTPHTLMGMR